MVACYSLLIARPMFAVWWQHCFEGSSCVSQQASGPVYNEACDHPMGVCCQTHCQREAVQSEVDAVAEPSDNPTAWQLLC